MYAGTDGTFTCLGAAMLCVCKRTERRPALRICQGPRDELQIFALMLRVAGGALCSNILHILLLICYHLSGPGPEKKTFPFLSPLLCTKILISGSVGPQRAASSEVG